MSSNADTSVAASLPSEILQLCLEYLEESDLNSATVVCRSWQESAVYMKWRTCVVPLKRVVELLGPATLLKAPHGFVLHSDSLSPQISVDQKSLFLKLTAALTRLHVKYPLSASTRSLMNAIAGTDAPICPNTVHVIISHSADVTSTCGGLIGPSLKTIDLTQHVERDLPPIQSDNPKRLLQRLSQKAPDLERLAMHLQYAHDYAYKGLTSLRSLHHSSSFSFGIWKSIARDCPKLEEFVYTGRQHYPPSTRPASIITLSNIQVVDLLKADCRDSWLIIQWSAMPSLKVVRVCLPIWEWENAQATDSSINRLAQRSPLLEQLTLAAEEPSYRMTWLPLNSLQQLAHLRSLTLIVWGRDDYSSSRAIGLLPNGITTLEDLTIKFEPSDYVAPAMGLLLSDLEMIPARLPSIRHLAVAVVADQVPVANAGHHMVAFEHLESVRLDPVTVSKDDIVSVASYLAGLCPGAVELQAKIVWTRDTRGFRRSEGRQRGDRVRDRTTVDAEEDGHLLEEQFRKAQQQERIQVEERQ